MAIVYRGLNGKQFQVVKDVAAVLCEEKEYYDEPTFDAVVNLIIDLLKKNKLTWDDLLDDRLRKFKEMEW